jgi:type IV pilus assembly protein PilO
MAAAKGGASLNKLPMPAKVGLGVALSGIVLIGYFIVFYSDVSSAINREVSREAELHEKLASARKAEFAYHQDLAELNDRQQKQREFNKILPESAESPAFLSAIQGVANVTGVNLEAWTPQEEATAQFYAKIPMKLKLSGKFHQIAKFLYGVGQLDRIINMEDIVITEPKADTDEIMIRAECMATAFRALPAPEAAPAGAPAGAAPPAAPPAGGGGH